MWQVARLAGRVCRACFNMYQSLHTSESRIFLGIAGCVKGNRGRNSLLGRRPDVVPVFTGRGVDTGAG